MKVRVLKEFTDIHTRHLHKVGEEFECTDERLAEIEKVSKKLVKKVETTARKKSEEKE